jgi:hypothetical protein
MLLTVSDPQTVHQFTRRLDVTKAKLEELDQSSWRGFLVFLAVITAPTVIGTYLCLKARQKSKSEENQQVTQYLDEQAQFYQPFFKTLEEMQIETVDTDKLLNACITADSLITGTTYSGKFRFVPQRKYRQDHLIDNLVQSPSFISCKALYMLIGAYTENNTDYANRILRVSHEFSVAHHDQLMAYTLSEDLAERNAFTEEYNRFLYQALQFDSSRGSMYFLPTPPHYEVAAVPASVYAEAPPAYEELPPAYEAPPSYAEIVGPQVVVS